VRLYLAGRLDIEAGGRLVEPRRFPGRQGRRAFAYLVLQRSRPTPRDELARAVWSDEPPAAWDVALSALVSKLRSLLNGVAVPGVATSISTAFGCYQLRLPADTWIDVEVAARSLDEAEGALRAQQARAAFPSAAAASAICRRPFLPGEEGAWIEQQRARLAAMRYRALVCLAEIWLAIGTPALAIESANEMIELEPFRETGYVNLMRGLAAHGDRAEALRVYGRWRELLADELGADPSPTIERYFLELLGHA
jgi:DNA-binding SARP family transcriptional activator